MYFFVTSTSDVTLDKADYNSPNIQHVDSVSSFNAQISRKIKFISRKKNRYHGGEWTGVCQRVL